MTGSELKQLREDLGQAIGKSLSAADMAKLCGLAPDSGPDTIRRWEVTGPSGPAGELLRILAMASDRYPILENFNVFDRFNIHEKDRPARRAAFRENMRDEIRRLLGLRHSGSHNWSNQGVKPTVTPAGSSTTLKSRPISRRYATTTGTRRPRGDPSRSVAFQTRAGALPGRAGNSRYRRPKPRRLARAA